VTMTAATRQDRPIGPLLLAWAFAIVSAGAGAWVVLFARRGEPTLLDVTWSPALAVGFTSVGAIILARRPGNPIARLCIGIGLVLGVHLMIMAVVGSVDVRPGRLPGWMLVLANLSEQLRWLGIAGIAALFARFPSGQLPSRRWHLVDVLLVLGFLLVGTMLFGPGELPVAWILIAANPIAVLGLPVEFFDTAAWIGFLLVLGALGLSMVALLLTYGRSAGVERAQIRWVLAAAGVALLGVVVIALAEYEGPFGSIGSVLVFVAPLLIPVGIGIAILRYRLYEIDRIVSRTIGYAAVTAVLALVFLGANLALQAVLAPLVRADTIVVAASTLLVAALFAPVRSRIQRAVDRRFHRARLDADRLAAVFAERLRDEVDLETLRARSLATAAGALEPDRIALWLRAGRPTG